MFYLKENKMMQVSFCIFMTVLATLVLVSSQQDQSGFISIDCGVFSSYTDESTAISYDSDNQYIDTGINMAISLPYQTQGLKQQFKTVRSFPNGTKNCYTLKPANGKNSNYLIRAYFMYGNYDSLYKPPAFDLYLGVDLWDKVQLQNSSQVVTKEIIHRPSTNQLFVCLANTGLGTPFISGLELRNLNDNIYNRTVGSSLGLLGRYYTTTSSDEIRYKDDVFDRIWEPMPFINNLSIISTTMDVNPLIIPFRLPSAVMREAYTTKNTSDPILFSYPSSGFYNEYYIYLYFSELKLLSAGQVREFNISINGILFFGPYSPLYLVSDSVYSIKPLEGQELNFSIHSTERSTLPPLLNAMEIFAAQKLPQISTNEKDVSAMTNIKSVYNITKNWQGDPCVPKAYVWQGVNCNYSSLPRIITLNLSGSGLTGNIDASLSDLTALQFLDLSNNELSGTIPDFLTQLPLKTLNLAGNSFTGSVPELLLQRYNDGSLSLSVGDLCMSTSCSTSQGKKKSFVGPIAACAVLLIILTAGVIIYLLYTRKKKQRIMQSHVETTTKEQGYGKGKGGLTKFSYAEITNMTAGFRKELGKGGFGIVYYGRLVDGTEVAVKMLSQSKHAPEQFSTEVELLIAIRHKNLVPLLGFCEEGPHLSLIYEYMANGNLQTLLSTYESLSWKQRLQIAIDSAQGLDYLHTGCRPPIVHRDVKTPNILLNKNLQAKIADFGLSKIFPDENKSYVSTRVIGTDGYLDPEYHTTEQLNEKSDVYSFGVVLLELITGKDAIIKISVAEKISLVHWVSPRLDRGDIWSIVDERMQEVRNVNSLWRATDLAMSCVKRSLTDRPTMSQIVTELKDSLAMEVKTRVPETGPDDTVDTGPVFSTTAMAPTAR